MASMICASRPVPKVAATMAWVSPRVKRAEPWARGSNPTSALISRTARASRPSIRGSPATMALRTTRLSNFSIISATSPSLQRSSRSSTMAATLSVLICSRRSRRLSLSCMA